MSVWYSTLISLKCHYNIKFHSYSNTCDNFLLSIESDELNAKAVFQELLSRNDLYELREAINEILLKVNQEAA